MLPPPDRADQPSGREDKHQDEAELPVRPDTAGQADADEAAGWTGRALRTLAGVSILAWSFRLSGYLTFAPWLAVAVTGLGLAGLLTVIAAWLPGTTLNSRRQHQIGWLILLAAIAGLALWSYFQVYIAPEYGTDEMAFDQYAAQLVLHGINPYLHSMAGAFPLFHVSPNGYTFRLNGTAVTSLSYPALAFEAYLPLLALGVTTQAAVWVDVAAWALSGVVLYAVLPRRIAPLAIVLLSLDLYIGYAVGGITDFLFLPLLAGAAVGWDRFSRTRGPAAWRGPVLMGLAMAVKQTPWLILPFVLAGIVIESWPANGWRQAVKDGGRYLCIAVGAFAVPNLPYLIASPGAWLRGVLTPLTAGAVPAGQGLISLSLSLPVGGGSLQAYNLAAVVVLAAALLTFAAIYPALKPAAFLIPSVVLFFASRSFGSYLVMLLPSALAAAATATRAPAALRWRRWPWAVGAGTFASAAAIATALTAASPLTMSIASVRTTGQLATVERVRLAVSNTSGSAVRPAFTIEDGMTMTAFWQRVRGPAVLGPHASAEYTIQAPSYFAMPSISNGFQVLAFTGKPPSVSRSGAYVATLWRVLLDPATVNRPLRAGQDITVRARIVDRLDRPVHVANVPVYLGQVTYTQHGTIFSEATINASNPGATPVQATTNANGVATFRIMSSSPSREPVYFEANLVNPRSAYPYGYSPILAMRIRR
ncbi:MAG: hypothetical protein ACR2FU_06235 [Streptosporangiaceae bacterium]